MMRLLVMGPPGAGKGTQCVKLAERFGVPHISSGDLFRHHISNKTELGVTVQKYLDSGEYVPDEITTEMVRKRLDEPDATWTGTRAPRCKWAILIRCLRPPLVG
jgi:adenylate kinase